MRPVARNPAVSAKPRISCALSEMIVVIAYPASSSSRDIIAHGFAQDLGLLFCDHPGAARHGSPDCAGRATFSPPRSCSPSGDRRRAE